ncbi:MAG: calmodulin [Afipia sp.]|jgi:hypothetical protein|nr:calmodulin [Afipia sp.]MBS4003786.1 calmodulin [Afipia sp.]
MAFFRCIQEVINRGFVVEITDEATIKKARAILSRRITESTSIRGVIVKTPKPYNRPWSWHLDPASIEFFGQAMEVCEASIVQVEKHLDEVGGAFLPHNNWCPWRSSLVEEVVFDSGAGMVGLPIEYADS